MFPPAFAGRDNRLGISIWNCGAVVRQHADLNARAENIHSLAVNDSNSFADVLTARFRGVCSQMLAVEPVVAELIGDRAFPEDSECPLDASEKDTNNTGENHRVCAD